MFCFGEYFVDWIKMILGCNDGTNFKAVTVVNGHISTLFDIKRRCRQGDPISGYLLILVMEILALLLKKNKLKLYKTKFGLKHFLDIYADNLLIFLGYNKGRESENKENVRNILKIMDKFLEWSGLKINLDKTYLAIFGKIYKNTNFPYYKTSIPQEFYCRNIFQPKIFLCYPRISVFTI